MVVRSSVVWFRLLPSSLVVWVDSCLIKLILIYPNQGILGGISVLMVSRLDHWNPVIISTLRLYVGFWSIPKGQLWSFWTAL